MAPDSRVHPQMSDSVTACVVSVDVVHQSVSIRYVCDTGMWLFQAQPLVACCAPNVNNVNSIHNLERDC